MRINLLDIRLNGGKTRKPVGDKPLPIVPAQHRDRFMASVSPRQKLPAAFSVRFGEKLETDRPSNEKVGPSDHLLTPPSTEHPAQATASSGVTSQAVSPMEAVGAIQPIEGVTVPPILRSILVEAQATAHKTGFPQIMLEHFAYAAIQHLSRVVMPASGPAGEKPNPPSQGLNQGLERAMLATSDLRRFSKQDFQLILPLALANTGIELSDAESASIKAPQKTIPLPLEPFLKEALQLTSHEDPHQQLFELMQYLRENDDRPGGSALEFLRNTSSGLSTRLSKEHFMEKLTKTSPALKFWLTEASAYAKLGGSSTIGIKHLISAAIDTALPLMDKAPEQMNIHSKYLKSPPGFDVYTARRSLDALLPPQIRENLSAEQVKTILREASHSLDTLIYPKHYPYGDAFVEPSLSPSLSGFLTRNTYVYHSPVGFNAANFIAAVRTDLLQSMPQHTLEDTAVQGILSRMVHRAVNSSSLLSDVTFDDIGGYTREKEQLKQFADFAKNPAYAEKVLGKGKFQRGLLLHGPTGTGKTYMVKALANYIGIPVIERNGTDLMTKYINSGPENIGKLFDEARSHKRALIFIDEIDALLRRRDSNGGSSSGEEGAKAVNKFLGELDGFIQNNPGIIVVGATNRKDVIDTAALRPGRLGTHIEIGLPDPIARKAILKIHTKDSVFAPDLDVDKLVTLTPQFSAAELAQLALQARIEAFNKASSKANPADAPEQPFVVGMDDFMDAYDTNYMGAPNPELHQTDFDKALVGNHEIKGHGLMGFLAGRQIQTVTTIARGTSGGHVRILPKEGFETSTRKYFFEDLLFTLAGRAAEEATFGKPYVTTGASHDYDQARQLLTMMISTAMIPGHGAINYRNQPNASLRDADEKLVNHILGETEAAALNIIQQLPQAAVDKINETSKGKIQLRGSDAMDFYRQLIPEADAQRMRQLIDQHVEKMINISNPASIHSQVKPALKSIVHSLQTYWQQIKTKWEPSNSNSAAA